MMKVDKEFDRMVVQARESIPHPLLNPDSKHYKMIDGVEAIERMEQMYSVQDLMAWAKISAMKYAMRAGSKNLHGSLDKAILSDIHKRITYEEYYRYLKGKSNEK